MTEAEEPEVQKHEDTINDPDEEQLAPPTNPEGLDELVEKDETNADPDTPKTAAEFEAQEAEAGNGDAEEADGPE